MKLRNFKEFLYLASHSHRKLSFLFWHAKIYRQHYSREHSSTNRWVQTVKSIYLGALKEILGLGGREEWRTRIKIYIILLLAGRGRRFYKITDHGYKGGVIYLHLIKSFLHGLMVVGDSKKMLMHEPIRAWCFLYIYANKGERVITRRGAGRGRLDTNLTSCFLHEVAALQIWRFQNLHENCMPLWRCAFFI